MDLIRRVRDALSDAYERVTSRDIVQMTGMAVLCVGVALVYIPAGVILAGFVLIAYAEWGTLSGGDDGATD